MKVAEFRFVLLKPKDKIPFENGWQHNGYAHDNPRLAEHINKGGNYGVIGGYGNLRIIDIDNKELAEKLLLQWETFTIKTGSGGMHFYYISEYSTNHVFADDIGEVRVNNYQVVGPGCIHPNGNTYKVIKDMPIIKISAEDFYEKIKPYLKMEKESGEVKEVIKDNTRSAREFREIMKLIKRGFYKNDIFDKMNAFAKWSAAPIAYKERQYAKALEFSLKNQNRKKDLKNSIKMMTNKINIVEKMRQESPFFFDTAQIWWIWNEKNCYWERKDETDILLLFDSVDINTIKGGEKNEWLNAMKLIGRKNIPKKIEKDWIQFKDIIIDIKTSEQFAATPEYWVTNPIPWKLGDVEDTPIMDKVFKEWVGEENRPLLYEILAYCMLSDYPIQRLFCFVGNGSNGKGKFLTLLSKFIGSNNSTSTELDTLLSSRFELARLYKKLIVIMGETNFTELARTSMLKKLTGGDMIGFEFKNKTPFEDINYAKIVIATNNLPTTLDKSDGFFRRWLIVDFNNQFTEKKDVLEDIPESEYNALAKKSLRFLKELLIKREFTNEGTIEERRQRFEDRSNPLDKFFKEFVSYDDADSNNDFIFKFEFRKRLDQWCVEKRFRTISEITTAHFMKNKGIWDLKKEAPWFSDDNKENKRFMAWGGIKWR